MAESGTDNRREQPGPTEMRDPVVRREFQKAMVWIGLLVLVAMVWFLAQPILLILAAIVLAAMLDGGARLLGRVLPIGRGWRLAIVILAAVGFLAWISILAGAQLAAQAGELQATIVKQVDTLGQWAAARGITDGIDIAQIKQQMMGSIGKVTTFLGNFVGAVTSAVMAFVLAIFIAIDPRLYERGVAWMLPMSERDHFYGTMDNLGFTLRRLMAGRLIGMAVEGVGTWLLLWAGGVPMAALLGVLTGLLAFIPNIGAIVSGLLIVLVGFSAGTDTGLYAIGVYLAVQMVDGYLIVPMVAKRAVDLAPALVLGAQILFGTLFGILGLMLADPIVVMIKVALERESARGSKSDRSAKRAASGERKLAADRIAKRAN
ncbi:AI-2E family transporter [Sphingorhabdus soli]|uniref:AI-2E family transporter n=1 Tax=Flavisphingopyxis soli TaxID=2601267 RepID=A0A5C6ULZ1_9SPHN|nr:AI-2E family transporter [Sphingorhabdus soli]TXC73889.1 AI-2E family transporter [Sphingorhabdus soli]